MQLTILPKLANTNVCTFDFNPVETAALLAWSSVPNGLVDPWSADE